MISSTLHITLVQLDIYWENPGENIQRVEKLLMDTGETDLIILPEMWSTGFTMQPERVAESDHGPAVEWMKAQSKSRNSVITGSISVHHGHHYLNRCYFTFPDGTLSFYDKKHLFSFGKEDQHYTPGNEKVMVEIKGWKVRPVICYDLRFPAWCRNTDDYDLLLIVANWPVPRIHHWDALLKARAIENQSYVAAVNRTGTDGNGLEYNGHTSLYDMNGTSLVRMDEKEGITAFRLDKEILTAFRHQFRFLQDRYDFTLTN